MTLNIKPGDWAVLRNGEVRGPLKTDGHLSSLPIYVYATQEYWMKDGHYISDDEDHELDIIFILPCPPLERIKQLEANIEALEEVGKRTLSSLVAAHSLLSRGGKKAAPSNTMFSIMLSDYQKAIDAARRALGESK